MEYRLYNISIIFALDRRFLGIVFGINAPGTWVGSPDRLTTTKGMNDIAELIADFGGCNIGRPIPVAFRLQWICRFGPIVKLPSNKYLLSKGGPDSETNPS